MKLRFMVCLMLSLILLIVVLAVAAGDDIRNNAQKFDVREFGAKGDGKADDAPAVRAAVNAAKVAGGGEIFFPAGRYCLGQADSQTHIFELKDYSNLTLNGTPGTYLIITNPAVGLVNMRNCRQVSIKGLKIDYDPLPFTQGTVTAVNREEGTVDWKVDNGYPDPMDPFFKKSYAFRFYGKDGLLDLKAPLKIFKGVESLGSSMYRSAVDRAQQGGIANIKAGQRLVLAPRYFPSTVIRMSESENMTIERVTAYAGPEVFAVQVNCNGTVIKDCSVEPPAGSNRLQSIAADGIFSLGGRRGPRIERCRIIGNGDDSINIHGIYSPLCAIEGEKEIIATETPWNGLKNVWREGDRLQILHKETGRTIFEGRILSLKPAEFAGRKAWKVQLDTAIRDKEFKPGDDAAKLSKALVFNLDNCGNGFIVRDSVFSNHRGRGVLLRSDNGLVEGNKFEWLEGGIYIGLELGWPEGPAGQEIVIRNNTFTGMGYMTTGAIEIVDRTVGVSSGLNNRKISIVSNIFNDCFQKALLIDNSSGIRVENNIINVARGRRTDTGFSEAEEIYRGGHCEGVILSGNRITVRGSANSAAAKVKIGDVWSNDFKFAVAGTLHNPSSDGFGNEAVWYYQYALPDSDEYACMDDGQAGQLPTWWNNAYWRAGADPTCRNSINTIHPGAKYDCARVFVSPISGRVSVAGSFYLGQPNVSKGVKLMVITPNGVENCLLSREKSSWTLEIKDIRIRRGDKIILRANNMGDNVGDNVYLKYYQIFCLEAE